MHWTVSTVSWINVVFGRHIAFYLSIYLAATAYDDYQTAAGDEILRSPPSDPALVPTLRIYSVLSIFSILWIFFVQYVNIFALIEEFDHGSKSKGLSTLVGLIDLLIGVWLALAIKWQTNFTPSSDSGCSVAANQTVSSGHENIFQRFSDLNGDPPEDVCSELVGIWKLALGLATLTLLASLVEFCNGSFVGFVKLCWAIGAGIVPAFKFILVHVCTKVPSLLFKLFKFLYNGFLWLSMKVGLYIPRRLAPPVRYRSRYWQRSREKHNGLPTHELRIWQVGIPNEKQISFESNMDGWTSEKTTILLTKLPPLRPFLPPMIRLLSSKENESIVLNIASFLHYSDVINLSLTSKITRSQLLKSPSRVEDLRIVTCISSKSECYSCNTQICTSCSSTHTLPPTQTHRHLHTCQTICSPCYRTQICGTKAIHSPPICACTGNPATPTKKPPQTPSHSSKSLCRNCAALTDKGTAIRKKRERSEIVHLAGQELKCGVCKMRVPAAVCVRWWVCGACGRECLDAVHPRHAGNGKGGMGG